MGGISREAAVDAWQLHAACSFVNKLQCPQWKRRTANRYFKRFSRAHRMRFSSKIWWGNVLDCNPAAAALHGTTRQELIGKKVTKRVAYRKPVRADWRLHRLVMCRQGRGAIFSVASRFFA